MYTRVCVYVALTIGVFLFAVVTTRNKYIQDIDKRRVVLMDPILATGNSLCRAIQLLRDHGTPEDYIVVLTIIAAPQGIHKLYSRYPNVKLITSEVDEDVDSLGKVIPGIGEFGDRYFGTDDFRTL